MNTVTGGNQRPDNSQGDKRSEDDSTSGAFIKSSVIAIAAAVGSAALGYIVGVVNDIRNTKLDFVNAQIEKLYGPLYAQTQANNAIWGEFRKAPYWRAYSSDCQKPCTYFFNDEYPPTIEEIKRWRVWVKTVFQPLNLDMQKAIVENSQLIVGGSMPQAFNKVVSHTEAYKVIISGWKDSDFDGCKGSNKIQLCPQLGHAYNTAPLNYPDEIITCVEQDYQALKEQQASLEQNPFAALYDSAPQRSKCDATGTTR